MKLVFVSHAALDKVIAKKFQEDVTRDFLGMCSLFVSSNLDNLNAGYEWNNVIKNNLQNCVILVGLLSPHALQRPWVYAEFGAAWIRDIKAIPVCHSGLERENLPQPLSLLQALHLSDAEHLDHLYAAIAAAVGCNKPAIDFEARSNQYLAITENIRIDREIVAWMKQIQEWNPHFVSALKSGSEIEDVLIPSNLDMQFMKFASDARDGNFLEVRRSGMAMGTRVGPTASKFSITVLSGIDELLPKLTSE